MTDRRPQTADRGRVFVALVLIAGLLAGCGGGDKKTIPRDEGATLIRQLKKAEDAAGDPHQCPALARAVSAAQATVQSLPSSVDSDTRASLTNGIKNLDETARQECQNANTETTTTPTTDTQTETTNTQTTPTTNTQTTPTTNTQTTPTTNTQTTPTTPGNGGTPPGQDGATAPGQDKKGGKKDKQDKPGRGHEK